jgi:hypothetical protein
MMSRGKHSNRKAIDLRSSEDTSAVPLVKRSMGRFDFDMEMDVRECIDAERNKLRSLDKVNAKKIVSNAESNLMHMLKSKNSVNCLAAKENFHPLHTYNFKGLQQRNSLFDEGKLEEALRQRRERYSRPEPQDESPLFEFCQRKLQSKAQ